MKKFLLLVTLAITAMTTAWAATDGKTYDEVNGLKCVNLWIMDRVHTPAEFNASPLSQGTYARMATMNEGIVYVSRSGAQLAVTAEGDSILQCVVYRFDAVTDIPFIIARFTFLVRAISLNLSRIIQDWYRTAFNRKEELTSDGRANISSTLLRKNYPTLKIYLQNLKK